MGIVSLLADFTPVTGALSVMFGIIGKNQANKRGQDGAGKATAGIVMGAIGFVVKLICFISLLN